MLTIDLTGKRAFVAGVADDGGFGFAIAKALAEAGATGVRGHVAPRARHLPDAPPAREARRVAAHRRRPQARVRESASRSTPSTTRSTSVPAEVREQQALQGPRRLHDPGARRRLRADFGEPCLDVVVHSLANGSEVRKELLDDEPRAGYLGAVGVSAYSMVSMVAALRAARPPGRRVPQPLVHGERARDPRLRRRHVEREGGARERHARARVRGRTQVGPPRQLHQRRSARVARGERDRPRGRPVPATAQRQAVHRADGRLREGQSPLPEALAPREVGDTAAFL